MAAFASAAEAVDNRLVADRNKGEWTLVVIPDTQHYSQNRGNAPIAYMHDAFEWMVATRNQLNIKFVQGLGDIVESGSFFAEWDRASAAWNKLYGEDFLFLNIQSHDPWGTDNPGARQWANQVIAAHPDHKVLLGTHDPLETSTIKRDILTQHDNIVMSNAGHSCARETRFVTFGPEGGVAQNFVVDYRCDKQEIMLLRYYVFRPLEDKVDYYTYSPIKDIFEEDTLSQGSFDLELRDDIGTPVVEAPLGQIKAGIRTSR